jgi:hypothetical protein
MIKLTFHIEGSWTSETLDERHTVEECFGMTDEEWLALPSEEREAKLDEYAKDLYEAQHSVFYSLTEE